MENAKATASIYSIKSIDMKANGEIIAFMAMGDYLKTTNCSFRDSFRMDLSMGMVNINTPMGISLRAGILRIRNEAREGILLMREELWNLTSIPILPRFLKFHSPMEPLILVSRRMV
jgi:hypothetical protein